MLILVRGGYARRESPSHSGGDAPARHMETVRLGIHVTNGLAHARGPAPISDHTPPTKPGDNTPQIIKDRGQQSCRAQQAVTAQHARSTGHGESNGATLS